jgi:hypothetical protein
VATLLDVVTLGIFEIITYKNHGWRHPGEYDRRRPKIVITYDPRDVILGKDTRDRASTSVVPRISSRRWCRPHLRSAQP